MKVKSVSMEFASYPCSLVGSLRVLQLSPTMQKYVYLDTSLKLFIGMAMFTLQEIVTQIQSVFAHKRLISDFAVVVRTTQ